MNIKFRSIEDSENLDKERIIFSVVETDFLGTYVVFKSRKTGEKVVSSTVEKTYWFPDKDVKKGDLVVLYTKAGVNTETKNEDGTTTHFFYWQSSELLWSNPDAAVVLGTFLSYDFKIVSEK
jgi:hypothetical protein